jgi:hypothetical protein
VISSLRILYIHTYRRARSEDRRWGRQEKKKVWMCDGGWWEERKWERGMTSCLRFDM